MPWYRTGTVAITAGQTTVTGTGTAFALNARVGDAFQGPDGRWYEVTNIASATVLSILPAYQGATVSGGAYGLAPMQGYVKESADRLRQLVDQWGSTLANLGTVSVENIVPVEKGGTGSSNKDTARANLGCGTAATLVATTSKSDSNEGRALRVADHGLGATKETHSSELSALVAASFFQALDPNPSDWPAGQGGYPMGINFYRSSAVRAQLAISYGSSTSGAGVYYRQSAGGLNTWSRLLEAGEALGLKQTWKNMTSSRVLGTTYTNTTTKPIQIVALVGPSSAANVTPRFTIDAMPIAGNYTSVANQYAITASCIVPPGSTYNLTVANGTAALVSWYELRE
ncbi:hypothetical protein [Pseudomonas putida]|uniref:hypothetical protein n=1 Tax=Pseudomonas putida TaxID=303 RepID=UPI001A9F3EBC|nr:hypothetical protein [Pseudomonas putida]